MVYTTHISYLEIYNEVGYDLLDPRHEASRLEDLPSVPPSFLYFTLIRLAHLKKSSSDFWTFPVDKYKYSKVHTRKGKNVFLSKIVFFFDTTANFME